MKIFYLICLLFISSVFAKEYKVQDAYNEITQAFESENWMSLLTNSQNVIKNFSETNYSKEAVYYLAVAYFNLRDFEPANEQFTNYLNQQYNPKFFQHALSFKFKIAEEYRNGSRKRLFNLKKSPKLASGKDDAVKIYDEIITILPNDFLAAKSYFGKAQILDYFEEYKDSIETYQQLVKKFPKEELSIDAYIEIAKVYLKQANSRHQDTDILDLAELNLLQFKHAFPQEKKIKEAENMFLKMKEIYAKGLYDIATFYERTKKNNAAKIYFTKIIATYPETIYAKKSKNYLDTLEKKSHKR